MGDRCEEVGDLPGDTLRRAVGGDEFGEGGLELGEFADQRVVLRVGDLGSVEDVVAVGVVVDRSPEFLDADLRIRALAIAAPAAQEAASASAASATPTSPT